jgi:Tfp pilus assembly protein PilF
MLLKITVNPIYKILSRIVAILIFCLACGCAPYSLPEKKTYSEKDDPYIYYAESLDAYDGQDYPLAMQKIDYAISLNGNLAQFYQLKGDIHRAQNENERALDAYKTAIKVRSNFIEVHEKMAEIYEKQKQFDEAIRSYKRAVGLEPLRIDLILKIVNCYIQWNEMDVAEYQLNAYKKSASELKVALPDQYYKLRGEVLFLTKRYEESLNNLKKVNQTDSLTLYLYGKNYYALKDFSTGVTYFNKLLNEDKQNGSWYFYRGIYFFNQKDYEDAKGQFEYGLKLDETLYETHYYLGKILLDEGDEEGALKEFQLYRQDEMDSEKAEEVNNVIQSLISPPE